MLEKELLGLGLNEKEVKVYLSSLELGQSTVQQVAQKAAVNRATAYFIIDALMQRGLMSSFYKGKKQYFIAADPERLLEILEQEKENIEKKKETLQKLLPQLQSLNNKQKDKPVVKYYEGKEGVKTMVGEVLKDSHDLVYMAYSVDNIMNFFTDEDRGKWAKTRDVKQIKSKVIYTYEDGELPALDYADRIKVPLKEYDITCDVAVYGDKVRIASLDNRLVGIIIEDKEIAKTMGAILKLAFEGAIKYRKK